MIVQCPACNSRYRIREANIPPSGGKIRCPSCGHSFVVYPESTPSPQEDDDRTSITSQNALNQLVSGMASNKPVATEERTEQLDKDEINRIRALQALASKLGDADDGTLEMQNPMKIWQEAQDSLRRQDEELSEGEDDYDAAPTEVVSGANLANLPFPGSKVPAREPVGERVELKSSAPPLPAPPSIPKPPSLPPLPSAPSQDSPYSSGPSPSTMNRPPSGQFPTARPPSGAHPSPPNYGQPDSGPRFPMGAAPQPPAYGSQDWDSNSDASKDILAAIDEVAGDEPMAPPSAATPNLEHGGPWKLKTNFGLTYEFPDNKSLRSWLSSRDELDGYSLSADGENFFAVNQFTQLKSRPSVSGQIPSTGMSHLGIQQPSGLGSLPGSSGSGQYPSASTSGQFPTPSSGGSGQYPSMGAGASGQYPSMGSGGSGQYPAMPPSSSTGAFTPPSQLGASPSQAHEQHQEVIQNTYRPPSRDAGGSKILWAVFVLLVIACVVLGLHTFNIVNFEEILGMESKPTPTQVAPVVAPVESIDAVIDENPEADIENLLKETRRDLRGKKLQSALDRLNTIETIAPNRAEVFELRAEAYEALGQTEEAEAAKARAEELKAAGEGAPEEPGTAEEPGAAPEAEGE